jgi:transposase
MTDPMVSCYDPSRPERVEVIRSVQRRRHWTTQEKVRTVEETHLPGQSVSIVARRHGISAKPAGSRGSCSRGGASWHVAR